MKWLLKTSCVIVDTHSGKSVFRSLEECPPEVRQDLRESLSGPNACTIMVANREALEAIRGRTIPPPPRIEKMEPKASPSPRHQVLPLWQIRAVLLLAGVAATVALVAWAIHGG